MKVKNSKSLLIVFFLILTSYFKQIKPKFCPSVYNHLNSIKTYRNIIQIQIKFTLELLFFHGSHNPMCGVVATHHLRKKIEYLKT